MNIFRKKLPDQEWLRLVDPLLKRQSYLVDNFESFGSARADSQRQPDAEDLAEAFFQLYVQTRQLSDELGKVGRPAGKAAQEAHKAFQQALKQWRSATEQGRKYSSAIAGGLGERAFSGGLPGRLSGSALVFQQTLFNELLTSAKAKLDYAGALIDSVGENIVSQTPPSRIVAESRYGKKLLDGIEGLSVMMDSSFRGWDPPYAPLHGEPEFDDLERHEIAEATAAKQRAWADHISKMPPNDADKANWLLVKTTGISDGLLKVASNRCREVGDYQAALRTWLKWYTNRSQRDGWASDPDAWILLTEIYTGLRDAQKAMQILIVAVTMVAAELDELDESMSDPLILDLFQQRLPHLQELSTAVRELMANTPSHL